MSSASFHTKATVLIPGGLAYCVVHSEDHYEALRATYPSPGEALHEATSPSSSSISSSPPDAVLWVLEEEQRSMEHCDYQPFHLDFGPWTWLQHCKLLAALQQSRDELGVALRRQRRRSRKQKRAATPSRRVVKDDDDTPSEGSSSGSDDDHDDDNTTHNDAPVGCDPRWASLFITKKGPMVLVVVRLYVGLKHATNVLTALGVMSVLAGIITEPKDVETYFPLDSVRYWTIPFHDATPFDDVEAHFELTMEDATLGALTAFRLWGTEMLDMERFMVAHDHFQKLENGDVSFIVPWRLVACASPANDADFDATNADSMIPKPASYYSAVFGDPRSFYGCVGLVVQLNDNIAYDGNVLRDAGVDHKTLFFPDGSCPPTNVVAQFFGMLDSVPPPSSSASAAVRDTRQRSAIALHCMAGLGRTGTLICLALMRDYGFTAKASIAWARLCRPGSVIGPQQAFLCYTESKWKQSIFDHKVLGTPTAPIVDPQKKHSGAATTTAHSLKATIIQTTQDHPQRPQHVTKAPKRQEHHRDAAAVHNVRHDAGGQVDHERNVSFGNNGMSSSRGTTPSSLLAATAPVLGASLAATVEVDRSSLVEVLINRRVSSRSPSTTATTTTTIGGGELLEISPLIPAKAVDALRQHPSAVAQQHKPPQQQIAFRDAGCTKPSAATMAEVVASPPVLSRYSTTKAADPLAAASLRQLSHVDKMIAAVQTQTSSHASNGVAVVLPPAPKEMRALKKRPTIDEEGRMAGEATPAKTPTSTRSSQMMTTYTVGQLLRSPQQHQHQQQPRREDPRSVVEQQPSRTVLVPQDGDHHHDRRVAGVTSAQQQLPPSVQSWLDEDAQRLRSPPHLAPPTRSTLLGLTGPLFETVAANVNAAANSPPKVGATVPNKKKPHHRTRVANPQGISDAKPHMFPHSASATSTAASSTTTTNYSSSASTVHRISITL